jgi:hypothetical protein
MSWFWLAIRQIRVFDRQLSVVGDPKLRVGRRPDVDVTVREMETAARLLDLGVELLTFDLDRVLQYVALKQRAVRRRSAREPLDRPVAQRGESRLRSPSRGRGGGRPAPGRAGRRFVLGQRRT